jgi:hypothetical protein
MDHDSKVIKIFNPKDGDLEEVAFLTQFAKGLNESGDNESAIENILKAIKINPDDPYLHYLQGNFLLSLHNYQDAVACYDKSLAIIPSSPEVKMNRDFAISKLKEIAEKYYIDSDYANAARSYDALTKILPNDPEINLKLNICFFKLVCNLNLHEMLPPSEELNQKAYSGNMIVIHMKIADIKISPDRLYVCATGSNAAGDMITGFYCMQKYPPTVRWDLIVSSYKLSIATLMLSRFPRKPEYIYVCEDSWANYEISRNNGYLNGFQGVQPHMNGTGLLNLILNPAIPPKGFEMDEKDAEFWGNYFRSLDSGVDSMDIPKKIALFFPRARSYKISNPLNFEVIVNPLFKLGCQEIYTNVHQKNDEVVPGTKPLSLRFDQLLEMIYNSDREVFLVGVLTGVFEILKFSKQKAVILRDTTQPGEAFAQNRISNLFNNLDLLELDFDHQGYVNGTSWSDCCLDHFAK